MIKAGAGKRIMPDGRIQPIEWAPRGIWIDRAVAESVNMPPYYSMTYVKIYTLSAYYYALSVPCGETVYRTNASQLGFHLC